MGGMKQVVALGAAYSTMLPIGYQTKQSDHGLKCVRRAAQDEHTTGYVGEKWHTCDMMVDGIQSHE